MVVKSFKGGIHPGHFKDYTESAAVTPIRFPEKVVIPLQQHIGAPNEPLVKKGDQVLAGQKIGATGAFVSAPVHASVSGKVTAVEKRYTPLGTQAMSVVIESDGEDNWAESINPGGKGLNELTPAEITGIIKEAGIVGMGGAAFPTHVKLSPPEDQPIDTIILNGAECEPFLTADHRIMLEEADNVVFGLKAIMKAMGVKKGIIGIEDNKPNAIKAMTKAAEKESEISVFSLPTKYPQGAEKMLIRVIIGREVPSGGLPMAVKVVIQNVGTCVAVAVAIREGKPLVERVVTVTGPGIVRPGNMLVRVGTTFADVIEQCGGMAENAAKLISGGPMMGFSQPGPDVPVVKGTSGILVLTEQEVAIRDIEPCIRCARCVEACPMSLLPNYLGTYGEKFLPEKAEAYHALDCIECGCCA